MGKRLIQQARGKGGPRYKSPSFKYKGSAKHITKTGEMLRGEIVDIITCRGHSAPLLAVVFEDNRGSLLIAPEGVRVGDKIEIGDGAEIRPGNIAPLKNVPEGALVYNIESMPGDGGKFCRSSGTMAKVLNKVGGKIALELPSKRKKMFNGDCRASIGVIAGSGRTEKPFLKAGTKHHAMKAKNKLYPIVSGSAMNAVDHPFGNARSSRKSKAKPISADAPPGRKVGAIAAKRTGRKKK